MIQRWSYIQRPNNAKTGASDIQESAIRSAQRISPIGTTAPETDDDKAKMDLLNGPLQKQLTGAHGIFARRVS